MTGPTPFFPNKSTPAQHLCSLIGVDAGRCIGLRLDFEPGKIVTVSAKLVISLEEAEEVVRTFKLVAEAGQSSESEDATRL